MAHAYTPGLKVSASVRHRVRRILPISGEVLVREGDRVEAQQVVARTYLPGEVQPLNLANQLSVPASEVKNCLLKKEGERIEIGEPLARTKGLFGFFKSEYLSKLAGTVESVSSVTGQLIIRGEPTPVQVLAFLPGTVVDVLPREGVVLEADVAMIQGIFGVGGEAYGLIRMACVDPTEELTAEKITSGMKSAIVIGGARMTGEAVRKAISVGAAAVVSGGMDDEDLKEILGYDLGVAITGSEQIGTTLVITEGFGEIAMAKRTFDLFRRNEGRPASVSGATQIRAGVMRPEIVMPASDSGTTGTKEPAEGRPAGLLDVGSSVRIIRDPHFGLIGSVSGLPPELQTLDSGSKARVVRIRLESGMDVTVPRANVELIEA